MQLSELLGSITIIRAQLYDHRLEFDSSENLMIILVEMLLKL